ncbi:MAG: PGN_0703 family putative restriction endonuclease [Geminicoccales bacterium]
MNSQASATLLQRIDVALTLALRNDHDLAPLTASAQRFDTRDLFIKGVSERDLPITLGRARLHTPHSGMALAINSFFPWRQASQQLKLASHTGFDAIQFDVRCPTGLRGTPPHLDALALSDDHAVGITVRTVEYLTRRRASIASSYDALLEETPGMKAWHDHVADWRADRISYRHIDLAALVKYVTALAHTFPDRSSTLFYLYWEPMNADAFDAFHHHRHELQALVEAVSGARVDFAATSFDRLWQDWIDLASPGWVTDHVARLRRRYAVTLDSTN